MRRRGLERALRNEDHLTFDEALAYVAERSATLPVRGERAAARRLAEAGIIAERIDRLDEPENAELREMIDRILYHDA